MKFLPEKYQNGNLTVCTYLKFIQHFRLIMKFKKVCQPKNLILQLSTNKNNLIDLLLMELGDTVKNEKILLSIFQP